MATKKYNADHIAKVLKGIQDKIPRNLIANAVSIHKLTPTVEKVMDAAISWSSETISEEKKNKIRELKAAGEFSKTTFVDNIPVQKKINNFVSREINRAIKSGELPPRSKIKDVDFIRDMYKRLQTHE